MHGYERLVFSMEPHLSLYIHDVEMGVRNRFFLLASFFLCWLFQLLLSLLLPQSSVLQQTISIFLLTSCYTIIPFLCDYIKLYVINNGAIQNYFFLYFFFAKYASLCRSQQLQPHDLWISFLFLPFFDILCLFSVAFFTV